MRSILQGWNFMRILRLVLGMIILVQGIMIKDIPSAILGFILGGMAVANVGCCGTNGCAVNPVRPVKNKVKIEHEELDIIK
jgi:hypothetical protein